MAASRPQAVASRPQTPAFGVRVVALGPQVISVRPQAVSLGPQTVVPWSSITPSPSGHREHMKLTASTRFFIFGAAAAMTSVFKTTRVLKRDSPFEWPLVFCHVLGGAILGAVRHRGFCESAAVHSMRSRLAHYDRSTRAIITQ